MDPLIARKTFRTLEPLHGFVYFSPDAEPEYVAAGLKPGRMGYFASRSAPMGAVAAEVVIATFFNFNHDLVRSVIPSAWHEATPERVLAARSGVSRLRQPNRSSSPQRPHDDPAGAPAFTGSSS